MRVLVFPGGTESGLEIWRSLRSHRLVTLISAGAPVSSHAPYVFARHYEVPPVSDPRWLPALNRVLRRERVDFIFPAHDDVALELARHRRQLSARIVGSPLRTCLICRSKRRTYRLLDGIVPTPRVYESPDAVPAFPVFVKPDRGQGSQDVHLARDRAELDAILSKGSVEYVIGEYLPGEEYTVDCFTDRAGQLRYVAGRVRLRIRNGIAVDTKFVPDPRFRTIALAVNRRLTLRGAWFLQLRRSARGTLTLLEVAPRIAGSMALDRVRGVNLPLLSLYQAAGHDVLIRPIRAQVEMDRALTNRFRPPIAVSHAYVDLDDTLLLREKVNTELVRLLYQFINSGVRLSLVTRHAANIDRTLERHRLAALFDDVFVVPKGRTKASVIRRGKGTIFIDDSFSERTAVAERRGVLTFDCSMLELLLDDRS